MDDLNQQLNNQQDKVKRFFSVPKIIFIILGVVLLVEIIFAVKTLTAPTPPPSKAPTTLTKTSAKIVLLSPKTSYNVGETVAVTVRLYTGGRSTAGTDVIVKFDPKILEATPGSIIRGSIYEEYPISSVDAKGTVSISGISTQKGFNGSGVFSIVNFKAKAKGQTKVSVDFQLGKTIGSNVVETGAAKNILEQVANLDLTIK